MKPNWNNIFSWTRDAFGSLTLAAGAALQAGILPPGSKPFLWATAIVTVAGILGKQATNPQTFPQVPLTTPKAVDSKTSLEPR